VAALLCVVLAASATPRNLIAGAIAIVVGFILWLMRRPVEPAAG
jgi:hypothetical protein